MSKPTIKKPSFAVFVEVHSTHITTACHGLNATSTAADILRELRNDGYGDGVLWHEGFILTSSANLLRVGVRDYSILHYKQ